MDTIVESVAVVTIPSRVPNILEQTKSILILNVWLSFLAGLIPRLKALGINTAVLDNVLLSAIDSMSKSRVPTNLTKTKSIVRLNVWLSFVAGLIPRLKALRINTAILDNVLLSEIDSKSENRVPISHFSPDCELAAEGSPSQASLELKELVKAMHDNGIEVLLKVRGILGSWPDPQIPEKVFACLFIVLLQSLNLQPYDIDLISVSRLCRVICIRYRI